MCDINNYFYSVSADLPPLDLSLVPDVDIINDAFVIEPYQVERKLAIIPIKPVVQIMCLTGSGVTSQYG